MIVEEQGDSKAYEIDNIEDMKEYNLEYIKSKPVNEMTYEELYSDYDEDIENIAHMKSINCMVMKTGAKEEMIDYYYCSCDPDQKHPICKECIDICHQDHIPSSAMKGKVVCHCGIKNHIILDSTQIEKQYDPQCYFHEISLFGNINVYYETRSTGRKLCIICANFCRHSFPDESEKNVIKKRVDPKLEIHPICECNLYKHKDIKYIYQLISKLYTDKNCIHDLIKISPAQFINTIFKTELLLKNIYSSMFIYLKTLKDMISRNDFKFDSLMLKSNFFWSLQSIISICRANKDFHYYCEELTDIFNHEITFQIIFKNFDNNSEEVWKFKETFIYCFEKICLASDTATFHDFSLFDMMNMMPHMRFMINSNIKNNYYFISKYICNPRINIINKLIDCIDAIINKNNIYYNFLFRVLGLLKYFAKYYLFTNVQKMRYCITVNNLFDKYLEKGKDSNAEQKSIEYKSMIDIITTLNLLAMSHNDNIFIGILLNENFEKENNIQFQTKQLVRLNKNKTNKASKKQEPNNNSNVNSNSNDSHNKNKIEENDNLNNNSNNKKYKEKKTLKDIKTIANMKYASIQQTFSSKDLENSNYHFFHSKNFLGKLITKNSVNVLNYIKNQMKDDNKRVKQIIDYTTILLSLVFNNQDFYLFSLKNSLDISGVTFFINYIKQNTTKDQKFFTSFIKNITLDIENLIYDFFNYNIQIDDMNDEAESCMYDLYLLMINLINDSSSLAKKELFMTPLEYFTNKCEINMSIGEQIINSTETNTNTGNKVYSNNNGSYNNQTNTYNTNNMNHNTNSNPKKISILNININNQSSNNLINSPNIMASPKRVKMQSKISDNQLRPKNEVSVFNLPSSNISSLQISTKKINNFKSMNNNNNTNTINLRLKPSIRNESNLHNLLLQSRANSRLLSRYPSVKAINNNKSSFVRQRSNIELSTTPYKCSLSDIRNMLGQSNLIFSICKLIVLSSRYKEDRTMNEKTDELNSHILKLLYFIVEDNAQNSMITLGTDIITALTSVDTDYVEIVLNLYFQSLKTLVLKNINVQNTYLLLDKLCKLFLNLVKFQRDHLYNNKCLLMLLKILKLSSLVISTDINSKTNFIEQLKLILKLLFKHFSGLQFYKLLLLKKGVGQDDIDNESFSEENSDSDMMENMDDELIKKKSSLHMKKKRSLAQKQENTLSSIPEDETSSSDSDDDSSKDSSLNNSNNEISKTKKKEKNTDTEFTEDSESDSNDISIKLKDKKKWKSSKSNKLNTNKLYNEDIEIHKFNLINDSQVSKKNNSKKTNKLSSSKKSLPFKALNSSIKIYTEDEKPKLKRKHSKTKASVQKLKQQNKERKNKNRKKRVFMSDGKIDLFSINVNNKEAEKELIKLKKLKKESSKKSKNVNRAKKNNSDKTQNLIDNLTKKETKQTDKKVKINPQKVDITLNQDLKKKSKESKNTTKRSANKSSSRAEIKEMPTIKKSRRIINKKSTNVVFNVFSQNNNNNNVTSSSENDEDSVDHNRIDNNALLNKNYSLKKVTKKSNNEKNEDINNKDNKERDNTSSFDSNSSDDSNDELAETFIILKSKKSRRIIKKISIDKNQIRKKETRFSKNTFDSLGSKNNQISLNEDTINKDVSKKSIQTSKLSKSSVKTINTNTNKTNKNEDKNEDKNDDKKAKKSVEHIYDICLKSFIDEYNKDNLTNSNIISKTNFNKGNSSGKNFPSIDTRKNSFFDNNDDLNHELSLKEESLALLSKLSIINQPLSNKFVRSSKSIAFKYGNFNKEKDEESYLNDKMPKFSKRRSISSTALKNRLIDTNKYISLQKEIIKHHIKNDVIKESDGENNSCKNKDSVKELIVNKDYISNAKSLPNNSNVNDAENSKSLSFKNPNKAFTVKKYSYSFKSKSSSNSKKSNHSKKHRMLFNSRSLFSLGNSYSFKQSETLNDYNLSFKSKIQALNKKNTMNNTINSKVTSILKRDTTINKNISKKISIFEEISIARKKIAKIELTKNKTLQDKDITNKAKLQKITSTTLNDDDYQNEEALSKKSKTFTTKSLTSKGVSEDNENTSNKLSKKTSKSYTSKNVNKPSIYENKFNNNSNVEIIKGRTMVPTGRLLKNKTMHNNKYNTKNISRHKLNNKTDLNVYKKKTSFINKEKEIEREKEKENFRDTFLSNFLSMSSQKNTYTKQMKSLQKEKTDNNKSSSASSSKEILNEEELLSRKILSEAFLRFMYLVNLAFDSKSTENDKNFLLEIFTSKEIISLLDDYNLSINLRTEVLRFYRMIFIDVDIDVNNLSKYRSAFYGQTESTKPMFKNKDLNNGDYVKLNFLQRLLKISFFNLFSQENFAVLLNEIQNFEKIIDVVQSNNDKTGYTFNNKNNKDDIYLDHFEDNSLVSKLTYYLENGVLLPTQIFLNKAFSCIYTMKGDEILKIYEITYYILKMKLVVLDHGDIFPKYENIFFTNPNNDLVESNIFKDPKANENNEIDDDNNKQSSSKTLYNRLQRDLRMNIMKSLLKDIDKLNNPSFKVFDLEALYILIKKHFHPLVKPIANLTINNDDDDDQNDDNEDEDGNDSDESDKESSSSEEEADDMEINSDQDGNLYIENEHDQGGMYMNNNFSNNYFDENYNSDNNNENPQYQILINNNNINDIDNPQELNNAHIDNNININNNNLENSNFNSPANSNSNNQINSYKNNNNNYNTNTNKLINNNININTNPLTSNKFKQKSDRKLGKYLKKNTYLISKKEDKKKESLSTIKILYMVSLYKTQKQNFKNSCIYSILSEMNNNMKINYRNLLVRLLFQVHQSKLTTFSLQDICNIILRLLKFDTTNVQKEIKSLIEEDKSQVNLYLMADQFFLKLINVIFLEYNPTSMYLDDEYKLACTIIKIFKYLCEEHNNFFQEIFTKTLQFQMDSKIFYRESNKNLIHYRRSTREHRVTTYMGFFDCLLLIANRLTVLGSWSNFSQEPTDFYYKLFSYVNELMIEIIQGNRYSLFMELVKKSHHQLIINQKDKDKKNIEKLINTSDILKEKPLSLYITTVSKLILKKSIDKTISFVRQDVSNFLLALLEEKEVPYIIKSAIISYFDPEEILKIITLNLKINYYKMLGKSIRKMLKHSKNKNNKYAIKDHELLIKQEIENNEKEKESNNNNKDKNFLKNKTLLQKGTQKSLYQTKNYNISTISQKYSISNLMPGNSLNKNDSLNKYKTVLDMKEKVETNLLDFIQKTVFCNNIEKYFEIKYFQSEKLSKSPEFIFAKSLFSFVKLSAVVYNSEKANKLFDRLSSFKENEIKKVMNDMINKKIVGKQNSTIDYYKQMIYNITTNTNSSNNTKSTIISEKNNTSIKNNTNQKDCNLNLHLVSNQSVGSKKSIPSNRKKDKIENDGKQEDKKSKKEDLNHINSNYYNKICNNRLNDKKSLSKSESGSASNNIVEEFEKESSNAGKLLKSIEGSSINKSLKLNNVQSTSNYKSKDNNSKLDTEYEDVSNIFGLMKDTKTKISIEDIENYFIYMFFQKITRIIDVEKHNEIVKVLYNVPYNVSFITQESINNFEVHSSIENRYSKLISILKFSENLLLEIQYNQITSEKFILFQMFKTISFKLLDQLSFYIVTLINLYLISVVRFSDENVSNNIGSDSSLEYDESDLGVTFKILVHIFLAYNSICLILWCWLKLPLYIVLGIVKNEDHKKLYSYVSDNFALGYLKNYILKNENKSSDDDNEKKYEKEMLENNEATNIVKNNTMNNNNNDVNEYYSDDSFERNNMSNKNFTNMNLVKFSSMINDNNEYNLFNEIGYDSDLSFQANMRNGSNAFSKQNSDILNSKNKANKSINPYFNPNNQAINKNKMSIKEINSSKTPFMNNQSNNISRMSIASNKKHDILSQLNNNTNINTNIRGNKISVFKDLSNNYNSQTHKKSIMNNINIINTINKNNVNTKDYGSKEITHQITQNYNFNDYSKMNKTSKTESRDNNNYYTKIFYTLKSLIILYVSNFFKHTEEITSIIIGLLLYFVGYIFTSHSFCLNLQMLLIVYKNTLIKNFLQELKHRGTKIISTFFVYFIFCFSFASIAFFNLLPMFDETKISFRSLFTCLLWLLRGVLHNGGVGQNTEAIVITDHFFYYSRLLFVTFYFFIVKISLMSMIFGTILDTFREQRKKFQKALFERQNVCYICGALRDELEQQGINFNHHINKVHFLWDYINYILFLKQSDIHELNSINDFALTKIRLNQIDWFPIYLKKDFEAIDQINAMRRDKYKDKGIDFDNFGRVRKVGSSNTIGIGGAEILDAWNQNEDSLLRNEFDVELKICIAVNVIIVEGILEVYEYI